MKQVIFLFLCAFATAGVPLEWYDDMADWQLEEVFYMDRSARRRFYRTSFDF